MSAFLPPIEKPQSLVMKLAYGALRRQFGKVPTPVKVFAARLPVAFGIFYGKISKLDKKLELSREMVMLVRERVAQLNVCLFCIDIGRAFVIKESMNEAKFEALDEYSTSAHFSEGERAALDYVTELTRDKQVNPETFAQLSKHYSERAICEIVWVVASEHFYNMTNIGLDIHSDMLCDLAKRRKGMEVAQEASVARYILVVRRGERKGGGKLPAHQGGPAEDTAPSTLELPLFARQEARDGIGDSSLGAIGFV